MVWKRQNKHYYPTSFFLGLGPENVNYDDEFSEGESLFEGNNR